MNTATLDRHNLRQTTGRLYWVPTGEAGFIDFGNCTAHKVAPDVQRTEHLQRDNGIGTVDFSLARSIKPVRVFTFDEHFADVIRLLTLGTASVTPPTAGNDVELVIDAGDLVVGRTFDLGGMRISDLHGVNGGPTVLVRDVDFTLDAGSGMLTIISGANFGTDWTFTYDYEAVDTVDFASFSRLLERGSFRYIEKDQFDAVPLRTETFTGQVMVTGWGENNMEGFNEYTVEVLVSQ